MTDFLIYTKGYCPYCTMAKDLLTQNNLSFEEKDIEFNEKNFEEFQIKTNNARTVPQIFDIRNENQIIHIGGYDNLKKKFDIEEI